jgi:hypothetical protein
VHVVFAVSTIQSQGKRTFSQTSQRSNQQFEKAHVLPWAGSKDKEYFYPGFAALQEKASRWLWLTLPIESAYKYHEGNVSLGEKE